ncbi:Essential protein Yae1 N-terminal [Euphorbia peplus]|nr:Essential protein Yae1 N-terminal [Euphorbia peplus]
MEGSFAKELYSESLQLSSVELNPTPAAIGADFKDQDGSFWGDSDDELDQISDLDREWAKRSKEFHTIGYRDGVIAGKEAIAQEGFNVGFKESVVVGYDWGTARGVTSALACLPNGLQEKLIETQEKRDKFRALCESMASLSTTDALKIFHDGLVTKKAVDAEATSDVQTLPNERSSCTLGNYVEKLRSLLLESPSIKSDLSVK